MAPMADGETIRILIRQASRWAVAAEQDANPLIRVLHANYAMAFVAALRQVASDDFVIRETGVDPQELETYVGQLQDWAVQSFAPYVPEMIPQSPLVHLAGEG